MDLFENQLPKRNICTVCATDCDYGANSKLHYSLIYENNITANFFSINSDTGEIASLVSFDRELCYNYLLTVEVTDAGTPPLKSRTVVIVSIKNIKNLSNFLLFR